MTERSRPLTDEEMLYDCVGEGLGATPMVKETIRESFGGPSNTEKRAQQTKRGTYISRQIDDDSIMRLETDGIMICNFSSSSSPKE